MMKYLALIVTCSLALLAGCGDGQVHKGQDNAASSGLAELSEAVDLCVNKYTEWSEIYDSTARMVPILSETEQNIILLKLSDPDDDEVIRERSMELENARARTNENFAHKKEASGRVAFYRKMLNKLDLGVSPAHVMEEVEQYQAANPDPEWVSEYR